MKLFWILVVGTVGFLVFMLYPDYLVSDGIRSDETNPVQLLRGIAVYMGFVVMVFGVKLFFPADDGG